MKNSIFKSLSGFLALVLILSLFTLTSFAADNHSVKHSTEQTLLKQAVVKSIVADIYSVFQTASLPGSSDLVIPVRKGYLIPVNDAKPDNTNYQLIHFEQLGLARITI